MNRREFVSGLTAATALAGVASTAVAAEGRRVALVIGNGAYRNVPALTNPPNDASDIAAALKRLGFTVFLATNAGFDDMRRGLIALGRDAAGADMAAVYFAGHGMEINGENWLIPVDADLKRDTDAANEAINLQSVMLQVSNTTSLGLVILDACRNNPFAARMNRSIATRAAPTSGLGRIEPVGNVLVAYAARDGTTALDGDARNSPFAAALLRNIEVSGVEVTFMFRNVRDDVMEATRNEQQPFVYGSLSRKAIYLAGRPAAGSEPAAPPSPLPAVVSPAPPQTLTIDPALVGTWEIMVPSGRGQSRWIWQIMGDGTYRFHAEPQRSARPHEGTMTATNGRWSLHATRGLSGYSDGGAYEIHDALAVITGKLGTGAWKRSAE
ncbi:MULTISPECIES: caspase family protein [unclassified Bradyrhizobium]|uniref:caspase family protein n=1 Tax=unclassified Bradyrhizobium TaxID=2631580 RepID=UPI0020B27EAC|nr:MULTISPECIES: caspase family protein [unclassified Bradyrhizobium]MCP3381308.1 caspase family protein [Bradyrhizobium sp. CCGUVB4N]MCP3442395.1 caspase family protein [Bradyrhizobium sp. CCGUVB14]